MNNLRTVDDFNYVAKAAFRNIYPNRKYNYTISVTFSGRLAPYNATVSRFMNRLHFKLSKKWQGINNEIVQGLIEELMIKIFGGKNKESINIDLYNNFIKHLHISIPKTQVDPLLEKSFDRVNEKYFDNAIEKPNLKFGRDSKTKLGSYNYRTDTISISRIFEEHHDIMDYIMYHEVLHKVLKFKNKGINNYHHTPEFKRKEKEFDNQKEMEDKIKQVIISEKRKPRPSKKKQFKPFLKSLTDYWQ